jgi:D-alanine-D-alanine ligase
MNEFGKVAVLMGGPSAEREISFLSGNAILKVLVERGVNAHAFDPKERPLFDLKREGFERVFIALHGRYGEDGTVQGALEVLGIPYTGSGVMASALAMDKWRTKLVWVASDIPTPRYRVVDATTDWARVAAELGVPLIVKPAREGSTIGLTKVTATDGGELERAYREASEATTWCSSRSLSRASELTASILGDRALPLIRIDARTGTTTITTSISPTRRNTCAPAGCPSRRSAKSSRWHLQRSASSAAAGGAGST